MSELLIPGIGSQLTGTILDSEDWEIVDEDTTDSFSLTRSNQRSSFKLWISKEDSTLLKLASKTKEDDQMRTQRIKYIEQMNELFRETGEPELEQFEDSLILKDEFCFDSTVFNDSIIVESILEF